MKFKCLFCNRICKLGSKHKFGYNKYYCNSHTVKVSFAMRYLIDDQLNYYEIYNDKYRIVISNHDYQEFSTIFDEQIKNVKLRRICSFDKNLNITPEKFETKIRTILTFL